MSKMTDAYGSPFMRAADLGGRAHLVTIINAEFRKLPDFSNPNVTHEKLILSFEETGRDVAVNATSARVLMNAFGESERDYLNKRVVLFAVPVNVGGQIKESVMIRLPRQAAAPAPASPPPPIDPTTVGGFDADEEIPF